MIKFLKKLFGKKIKQYIVTITKQHCLGRSYMSVTNCPLAAAIRQQLPEFSIRTVGGFNVTDSNNHDWRIDTKIWNERIMEDMLKNKISECKVTLTY